MSTPPGAITVCAFDAYGTLFDIGNISRHARPALGERADTLVDLWRRKQLEYTWLRSLMGRHADFWHVTGESLDYAMATLGVADPVLRSRLMEAFLTPSAFPDAAETLRRLRAGGMRTAILSNGSPSMLTAATKNAGLDLLLDAVLSVESVGVFKPHPSVYRLVADRWDVQPSAVSFQTANGWDAAGASAFGFHVVWINRTHAPRDGLPGSPHAEITSLSGLPSLLGLA